MNREEKERQKNLNKQNQSPKEQEKNKNFRTGQQRTDKSNKE